MARRLLRTTGEVAAVATHRIRRSTGAPPAHRIQEATMIRTKPTSRRAPLLALAVLLALPLAAQAGRNEANTALTQATSGVAAAERAGAPRVATVELGQAHDQLLLANRHCERRAWDDCERAAHRAHADARLAEARTRQHNAESATRSLEAAVDTLRNELARQGG
jgi:hypothetical protein